MPKKHVEQGLLQKLAREQEPRQLRGAELQRSKVTADVNFAYWLFFEYFNGIFVWECPASVRLVSEDMCPKCPKCLRTYVRMSESVRAGLSLEGTELWIDEGGGSRSG